ncbi:MAG TPA: hypothetical protein VNI77_09525 [Nitrososphaera sp.]|nr:hypothetical protein [Nitrososphaera sp.]
MCRQINSPNIKINERAGNSDIVIALDRSTGIKVVNRARRKLMGHNRYWHVRRGYLNKIQHICVWQL